VHAVPKYQGGSFPMIAHSDLSQVLSPGPLLIAIGVFDGVHRGHQYLLEQLKAEALTRGLGSGVVTLKNNPRTVLRPEDPVSYLCGLPERLSLLQDQQLDLIIPLTFDLDLSYLDPKGFMDLLRDSLDVKGLVVGPDFVMGHNRSGNIPTLKDLGEEMGFSVSVVDPLAFDGETVSSSAVRRALAHGDVSRAEILLGRPFKLHGVVSPGEGIGRKMGFPTANLDVDQDLVVPYEGVYATWLSLNGRWWQSATSVGTRSTFGLGGQVVESYILDFDGDLYGESVDLEFVRWIRGQQRFDNPDELVTEMQRDVEKIRFILAENNVVGGFGN